MEEKTADNINAELNASTTTDEATTDSSADLVVNYEDVLSEISKGLTGADSYDIGKEKSFTDTAKKIKQIANSLPNRPPFSSMTWWKKFQYLYNAFIIESTLKANVEIDKVNHPNYKLVYGDSAEEHTTFKSTRSTSQQPDFVILDTTKVVTVDGQDTTESDPVGYIEVKLCQNRTSFNNERSRYHYKKRYIDCFFFVICFIIDPKPSFVYKVAIGNKTFRNCDSNELAKYGIRFNEEAAKQTIINSIAKFDLDITRVPDTELLSCRHFNVNTDAATTKVDDFSEGMLEFLEYPIVESHGAYSNQLDLTKALANKDKCIRLVRNQYGYDGSIEIGGFYIMPDGTAVKSVNHADIDKFLIRNKYIAGKVEDYGDGSQFMDAINCVRIRCRGGKDSWIQPYMIIPDKQLTQAQYDIIENWVEFVLATSGCISVQAMNGEYKNYKTANGDDVYDVLAGIHKFYRTAVLENFEYELLDEPEIDDSDYILERNLENGFFDQFGDLTESEDTRVKFTALNLKKFNDELQAELANISPDDDEAIIDIAEHYIRKFKQVFLPSKMVHSIDDIVVALVAGEDISTISTEYEEISAEVSDTPLSIDKSTCSNISIWDKTPEVMANLDETISTVTHMSKEVAKGVINTLKTTASDVRLGRYATACSPKKYVANSPYNFPKGITPVEIRINSRTHANYRIYGILLGNTIKLILADTKASGQNRADTVFDKFVEKALDFIDHIVY